MTLSIDDLLREARSQRRKRAQSPPPTAPTRQRAIAASPYRAVALVLPLREITCSCGAKHTVPDGSLLVQFNHVRTSAKLYIAEHPARMNDALPRRILILRSRASHCQSCFTASPSRSDDAPWLFPELEISGDSPQHELPLRYLPREAPPRHSHDR